MCIFDVKFLSTDF